MRHSVWAGWIPALFCAAATAGTLTTLDDAQNGYLSSISRNGRIATGSYVTDVFAGAFRWRKGAGSENLAFGSGMGMTSWAQPIAGSATDVDGNIVAALAYSDSEANGPFLIGAFPGSAPQDRFYSQAYGISDTGVVVGLARDPSGNAIAFRWSAAEGMSRLAVNRPDTFSRANGVSANGQTIYGWNDQPSGYRSGVIWVKGTPMDLHNPGPYGDAFGSPPGEAFGSNRDGSVVVGQGYYTEDPVMSQGWRWSAATGLQPIGIIAPPPERGIREAFARLRPPVRPHAERSPRPDGFFYAPQANPLGVSDDGNIIVGNTGDGQVQQAFIWTPADGMVLLSDYAPAHGITIPDGMFLISASSISSDGKILGGIAIDPTQSYVVSWIMDFHDAAPRETILTAQGSIAANDLAEGPFAGYPVGAAVSMTLRFASDGSTVVPGHEAVYTVAPDSFRLTARYQDPVDFSHHSATETLSGAGALLRIRNDDPRADGVELSPAAVATDGQSVELSLSDAAGALFDSEESTYINRTFGPPQLDATDWSLRGSDGRAMTVSLQWVNIADVAEDKLFEDGFDGG